MVIIHNVWESSNCYELILFFFRYISVHNNVAMPPKPKTRNEVKSGLTDYLGTGRDMLASELPTLRAALREAVLIREQRSIQTGKDIRSIPMTEVMDTVVTRIRRLWLKSNSQFMPPVTVEDRAVKKKLMDAWRKASHITRRRITNLKDHH